MCTVRRCSASTASSATSTPGIRSFDVAAEGRALPRARPTGSTSGDGLRLWRGDRRPGAGAVAGELGLEPRTTVPKTAVLPLHHSPAGPARDVPDGRFSERRGDSGRDAAKATPASASIRAPAATSFSTSAPVARGTLAEDADVGVPVAVGPIDAPSASRRLRHSKRRNLSPIFLRLWGDHISVNAARLADGARASYKRASKSECGSVW